MHVDGRCEVLECYRLDQAEEFVEQGHWKEVSYQEARRWLNPPLNNPDVPLTGYQDAW